jgi:hypothetical protein
VVTRSALVGIIHEKTVSLPSVAHKNGEAVTLMTTDSEGLDGAPEMFHETWAQTLEVVIGIGLMSREVGWIWPLPLVLIFCRLYPRGVQPSMVAADTVVSKYVLA